MIKNIIVAAFLVVCVDVELWSCGEESALFSRNTPHANFTMLIYKYRCVCRYILCQPPKRSPVLTPVLLQSTIFDPFPRTKRITTSNRTIYCAEEAYVEIPRTSAESDKKQRWGRESRSLVVGLSKSRTEGTAHARTGGGNARKQAQEESDAIVRERKSKRKRGRRRELEVELERGEERGEEREREREQEQKYPLCPRKPLTVKLCFVGSSSSTTMCCETCPNCVRSSTRRTQVGQ